MVQQMLARPPLVTFRGYYISNALTTGPGNASGGWNSVSKRITVSSSLHSADSASPKRMSYLTRLASWYSQKLDTYPLLTNATTCAVIAVSGDVLCQYISYDRRKWVHLHAANTTAPLRTDSETESKQRGRELASYMHHQDHIVDSNFQPDQVRMARFGSMGFFLVAPAAYMWFGALHIYVPGTSVWAITKRVLYDQLVFSPIFEPLLVINLMAMEGRSAEHMTDFLKNKAGAFVVANWILWFPAQFINFAFVPFKWQVLFSNLVSVIWNAYISFTAFEQEDVQEQFVHPT